MNFIKRLFQFILRKLKSEHERLGENGLVRMIEAGTKYTRKDIKVLFELGANHGQDGHILQKFYDVKPENTYLFEPHPELVKEIKIKYPNYKLIDCALSDKSGSALFNIAKIGPANDGVSTLGDRTLVKGDENFRQVEVVVKTLDEVMDTLPEVKMIDLMKIDVEGFTYEVLKGGEKTFKDKVSIIQLESEVVEVYRGQKLYPEVRDLLEKFGFEETYKIQFVTQNDTVWVKRDLIMKPEEFYQIKA